MFVTNTSNSVTYRIFKDLASNGVPEHLNIGIGFKDNYLYLMGEKFARFMYFEEIGKYLFAFNERFSGDFKEQSACVGLTGYMPALNLSLDSEDKPALIIKGALVTPKLCGTVKKLIRNRTKFGANNLTRILDTCCPITKTNSHQKKLIHVQFQSPVLAENFIKHLCSIFTYPEPYVKQKFRFTKPPLWRPPSTMVSLKDVVINEVRPGTDNMGQYGNVDLIEFINDMQKLILTTKSTILHPATTEAEKGQKEYLINRLRLATFELIEIFSVQHPDFVICADLRDRDLYSIVPKAFVSGFRRR